MSSEDNTNRSHISRRTVVRGAVWSAPVLLTVVAAPAASASVPRTVTGELIIGHCGTIGLVNPTFSIYSGSGLPVGTTFTIKRTGASLDLGGTSINGVSATMSGSPASVTFTTTAEMGPGQNATISLPAISLRPNQTVTATITFPAGYVGTGKDTGTISTTAVLCSST